MAVVMKAVITQRLEVRFASKAGLTWCWLSVIASDMMFLSIRTGLSAKSESGQKQ